MCRVFRGWAAEVPRRHDCDDDGTFPVNEESAPTEDGEGGEDESMQEGAEEGRRRLFRKSEKQPSSQEVQERMKTHIPYRSWCAHCVSGRERNDTHRSGGPRDHPHFAIDYGLPKANNTDDLADQESNPILIGAESKYAKRVADWSDWLGSQTVLTTSQPFSLWPRRFGGLRRESSITIFEHPEEGRSRATILLRAA